MADSHEPNSGVRAEDLNLVLDNASFVPFYQQIVDHVRGMVKDNRLKEGQVFCSEGEIAKTLGVSKMPVRQAFQKLRSEGLLIIARGKKPTIGSGKVPWNFQQLRGFSEEMKRRGLVPAAKVLGLQLQEPDKETVHALKLGPGEQVYAIRRMRSVNGEPVAVVTSYLPARIFAGIEKQDLERQSLYHVIETFYRRRLHWAEEVIGAVTARDEEAEILLTSPGTPLLNIRETTYDVQHTPIEFSVSLLRGDRYTASMISIRKS